MDNFILGSLFVRGNLRFVDVFLLWKSRYVVLLRNECVEATSQHLSLEMLQHTKRSPPLQKSKATLSLTPPTMVFLQSPYTVYAPD